MNVRARRKGWGCFIGDWGMVFTNISRYGRLAFAQATAARRLEDQVPSFRRVKALELASKQTGSRDPIIGKEREEHYGNNINADGAGIQILAH
jgi:hypothetical protein